MVIFFAYRQVGYEDGLISEKSGMLNRFVGFLLLMLDDYIFGTLFFKGSAKNHVPEFGAYTESILFIRVMVGHVMLLQLHPKPALDIGMVKGIMGHIIKKIPCNQTYKEGGHMLLAQYPAEKEIKTNAKWHTNSRNHYQSHCIAGIIVMHLMKYVVHLLTQLAGGYPMEKKPVQSIFRDRPNKQAQGNEWKNNQGTLMIIEYGIVKEHQNDRDIDNQWGSKVNPRQEVEKGVRKHWDRFVLI